MGVNRITGKEILIQEIKRLNGGSIKQEAIDEVFNNLKEENGGSVKFDDFSNKLCTLYSLDENDEDFKKYLTEISNFDKNGDNFSIEDLNAEFEYAPTQKSKEQSLEPMTAPAAHHSQTSTATSEKAKGAKIGMDENNNPTSVTLSDGTVFDISNNLIANVGPKASKTSSTYDVKDKGVTVKDGYWPNGALLSRKITTSDNTTLIIYYNKTGEINGIYVDDYMDEDSKIYSYNSVKPAKTSDNSTASDASAQNNTTASSLQPAAANETQEAPSNNEAQQQAQNDANTLYDENNNAIGTKETNNNITINRYNDGKTTVTMNGKELEIAYEKDGVFYYSQSGDGNWSHRIEQKEDGSWQYIEMKSDEATIPQILSVDGSYYKAITKDNPEYAQTIQAQANEIANAKKPEKQIKELIKNNNIGTLEKMAILELLSNDYSNEIKSAMAANDKMLKEGLEELLKAYDANSGNLSADSLITFENYYMELQKDDDITGKVKEKEYADIYLQIYERAAQSDNTTQKFKDIDNANNSLHYSIPKLALLIQDKYSNSDETNRLKKLVNATGYDEQIESAKNNPPKNADELKEKYLSASADKDKLKSILDGIVAAQNGENGLKYNEAIYLLSQVDGLDSAKGLIENNFRKLKGKEQEQYIEALFNALAYRNDTVKTTANEVKEAKTKHESENTVSDYTSIGGDDAVIRSCILDEKLTVEDRLKALKWQKANQGFDSQVSEIIKSYAGEPVTSDIKTIVKRSDSTLEDVKNYLKDFNNIADIEEPNQYYSTYEGMNSYMNIAANIFNYKKDEFTKESLEEFKKLLGTDDFMLTLKLNYSYVKTETITNYLKALNSVEASCGTAYAEPSQDIIDTYLIHDTIDKNINNILYSWQCSNIDDDTAKALLMKAINS